ncbi:hypothetical protein NCS56_00495700 [Fusarium sp. Ph1]|nr:hypothetical protein NCS56_00495700 [Fusarium sp. Ph1]
MASAYEAEQVVRHLTGKYGLLDEQMMDDIEQYNAEYRRKIDQNWMAMENAVSHSVKILAKQIYGSGARFVFELLQNAEDNVFKKAIAAKARPFISFKIHPSHIIVDCNEDGFTERDLEALCAVGQSTKSASHGYIGAKGIGFKSVFIAASRVHIQSGHFSFEFRHNKTDPGIGMVRPIWIDPTETIPNPLTRMTLYLHDQGDQGEIQHLKRIISMQFDDLEQTCLLFLRKLEHISLEFYHENGQLERSKQFRKHTIDEYRVSLETTLNTNGKQTTERQVYHITKQTATGLARSDNRELPDIDEAQRLSSTAEVVLAFPVTSDSKPLVTQKNQDLFAFLPLRRSHYKFLIHSDFDTNANRQDIVITSRRNLGLLDWIADAFYQAVLQFCEHPTLCYDWPMFLPSPDNSFDVFWSGLDFKIRDMMKKRATLRSRNRNDLRLITDIFILVGSAMDGDGQPLFDNSFWDYYLSPNYSQTAVNILQGYGLRPVPVTLLIQLLEADLKSAYSKMRGKHTADAWHSHVARMLSLWFEKNFEARQTLQRLALLPLRDGEWTSTTSGPVYFPQTGDIGIPDSLDLRVISRFASDNPDRNTLFRHLGASEAAIDQVRASILRTFNSRFKLSANIFKSYLDFLYLTHQPGTRIPQGSAILVFIDGPKSKNPRVTDIYLPGMDRADSPMNLLAAQGTAPGLSVDFLHSLIMDHAPARPSSSHLSWERWLCDVVGVRERLRLLSRAGDDLSGPFLYVLQHRPERFLMLFEHLWSHEKSSLVGRWTLLSKIQHLDAKQLCGVNLSLKLKETWLPFKHLRGSVVRYMEHPEQFPFLKLEESDMAQRSGTKWNFLNEYFSVGKDDNVDFLLEILSCIERSCPEPSSVRQSQMVFDLYVTIYAKLAVADDEAAARRKIREYFAEKGILDPDEKSPTWTSSSHCLWIAPPDMITAHSLRTLYSRRLGDEQMGTMENLFQRTLGIRDASLKDLVAELGGLREEGCEDILRIRALYEYLEDSMAPSADMRAAFEASPLIYHVTQHGEPEPIRRAKIFPVRYPNGTVVLSSVGVDFAIGDREKLKTRFQDKISLLDFNLEDIRRLKPLFEWASLQDRYLSNSVQERTSISSDLGHPISSRNRDLKRKAYYIARVAATFHSPRFKNDPGQFYKQLRTMTVLEVDGISSVLEIYQNKQLFRVQVATANEHINDETSETLMIYVPKERRAQELCFGSVLPRKLAAWLMRRLTSDGGGAIEVDVDAVNALTSIFACDRSVLDDILDDQGIIQVSFENKDQDDEDEDGEEDQDQEQRPFDSPVETHYASPEQPTMRTHSLANDGLSPDVGPPQAEPIGGTTETVVETISQRSRMSHQPRLGGGGNPSQPPLSLPLRTSSYHAPQYLPPTLATEPESRSSEDAHYRAILDRVVETARRTTFGAASTGGTRDALSGRARHADAYDSFDGLDVMGRFRSTNQLERDKKIGAAGELYIFELLSKLEMPGWDRANWQSTIRSYVTIHPGYTNMEPWTRRETADLVYIDTAGHLTDMLIRRGYLDHDEWHGARPKYYIEVKTTTGPRGTPFYMSGKQYQLMQRVHSTQDRSEVYMIFRVFWLNSDGIGLSVYSDPEKLRQQGQLLFTGQTWSITPGDGTQVDG